MTGLLKFTGRDIQEIDFEPWLESKPEALRGIARKWFEVIQNCGSDVEDIFHDGHPVGCVDEAPFAYINVYTHHANLGFFYGAELIDNGKLLEGTGKRMRHIKLRPDAKVDDQLIKDLIEQAYLDIKARLSLQ